MKILITHCDKNEGNLPQPWWSWVERPPVPYAMQHLMYLLLKKYGSTKTVWDRTKEIYSVYIIYHHQIRNAAQRFIAGDEKRSCPMVHSRQVDLHPRAQISGEQPGNSRF